MAKVYAFQSFNMAAFDLSTLVTAATDDDFSDNANQKLNGVTYQDVAAFEYFDGGYRTAYFGGTGFTFSAQGQVQGGTVTGVAEFSGHIGDLSAPAFIFQGISVAASTLAGAAATPSTTDDFAIISSILSGNDTFYLSDQSDLAGGFGGNDTMYGNGGLDYLSGGKGNDTLLGGDGNDYLSGDEGGDILKGGNGKDFAVYVSAGAGVTVDLGVAAAQDTIGAGKDTLVSIENLTGSKHADHLSGNGRANVLTGAGGTDVLTGRDGNDTLLGGDGHDKLKGGAGADAFVFSSLKGGDSDVISDFRHSQHDVIRLDHAIFAGLTNTAGTAISSDAFRSGAGVTAAHDASDRMVYDTSTGKLYYDADGSGSITAVLVAQLGASTHPALAAGDILTF